LVPFDIHTNGISRLQQFARYDLVGKPLERGHTILMYAHSRISGESCTTDTLHVEFLLYLTRFLNLVLSLRFCLQCSMHHRERRLIFPTLSPDAVKYAAYTIEWKAVMQDQGFADVTYPLMV
jgi:hypothetical protein